MLLPDLEAVARVLVRRRSLLLGRESRTQPSNCYMHRADHVTTLCRFVEALVVLNTRQMCLARLRIAEVANNQRPLFDWLCATLFRRHVVPSAGHQEQGIYRSHLDALDNKA